MVWGKCQGFYITWTAWQNNIKHNRLLGGKLLWFYQVAVPSLQGGGYSWELLEEKSKYLLFPGAEGLGLHTTGALGHNVSKYLR